MSEFRGTKGKWRVEFDTHEFCDTGDYETDAVVKSGNFTDICQVFLYDEEQEANAKLIAAAPELLSEHQMDLQHLKTWKKQLIDAGLRGSIMYQEYLDMIDAKEKAIKKALGDE